MVRGAKRDEGVVAITDAPTSRADEIATRQRRYMLSMGLRVLCFVGAIVTDGVLRYVLVAGALIIPYFAVVVANAVGPRSAGAPPERVDVVRPQLPSGR
ncbi:MAG: hypothetical protein JWO46_2886 [Nocardioidaceae bacterium]|nr:hypothetical protein [Nocardioidaceae bacterium]